MSTTTANRTTSTTVTRSNGAVRVVALLTMIAGLIFIIAGGATWAMVASQLKEEQITVAAVTAADPGSLAGKLVQDPFTAYAQANAIKHHSLTAGGGLTYAQLGDAIKAQTSTLTKGGMSAADAAKDPSVVKLTTERTTSMNGSFLRASLFTSVVAFGIAALVMGLGVLFILIGWAMRKLAGDAQLSVVTSEPSAAA
ncbi:MAG TPA: aromatic ring-opening dioxygenase LigA [Cellulomonadaceae bacterium]|nr:aromatic ring-opening dioxygenase LigA [Cellulomonadaceae bacterium]